MKLKNETTFALEDAFKEWHDFRAIKVEPRLFNRP